MIGWILRSFTGAVLLLALLVPPRAGAVPSYSRKYATSCSTCHTIYPKLTHFGEAFRRNGYRFPGVYDTDYVKQDLIPMGQDAARKDFPNSTWPSFMTNVPLLAFGVSSRMTLHPDTGSTAARLDNGTMVSFDRLANAGSLHVAGNIDETLAVRASMSVSDTGTSLDEAVIVWSDVVGPRGAVNLTVGSTVPTLTAWARTSSYVGGGTVFALPATTLFGGAGAPFRVTSKYNLAEVNGILLGRLEYGLGLAGGGHVDGVQPAENVYGHLAWKLGGMRLDGEGNYAPPEPSKPWAETSFTLSAFAYQSRTRYTAAAPVPAKPAISDRTTSLGGNLRLQVGSAELDLGALFEDHSRVTQALDTAGRPGQANLTTASGELSYVVYPWLVPAVRVEHAIVTPRGLASASNTRILPAVGMQLRPNVKLAVTATLEQTSGLPAAGGDWSRLSGSGLYLKPADNVTSKGLELSLMTVSASLYF